LEKHYNLKIKPKDSIRKLTMIAQNREITIKGHLGYIFERGPERASLERQLFSQVEADMYMDTYIIDSLADDIARQFDSVVIATGGIDIPDYFGIVADSMIISVRSGIMDGKFETGKIVTWVKTEYSEHCYVYLIPISETRAKITLMADNISVSDLDSYWKKMLTRENIHNNFLETWDCEYHSCRLRTNRMNNIYFIGSAGGMTDDFIGFGIINGITCGILAAEAIVRGKSFEKSIKPVVNQVNQLHNLRMLANKMDGGDWKHFVTFMGMPGIRHAVYKHHLIRFHHLGSIVGTFMHHKR
jgi:hypothetical protein